jgi:Na+/phosphate symporter
MEEKMKDLIENYQFYISQSDKLHKKLIQLLDYNTKLTAEYGFNTGGSKGTVNSKVERHVLRIKETEEKINEVERKIYTVNIAERVLNNKEKEVVEMVKIYRNKITRIAKALNKNKNYVVTTRNRAIKKMSDYMEGNYARDLERH